VLLEHHLIVTHEANSGSDRAQACPRAMRQRRETVEHPFGTATQFLAKTFPKVAAEMALSVLAYNLTRAMNIVGIKPMIAAIAVHAPQPAWISNVVRHPAGRYHKAKVRSGDVGSELRCPLFAPDSGLGSEQAGCQQMRAHHHHRRAHRGMGRGRG